MENQQKAMLLSKLPPAVCGVGDYAVQVCQNWPSQGNAWRFIVFEQAQKSAELMKDFSICQCEQTASGLEEALGNVASLLIHYTPYGFDPNGAPRWLVDGLQNWLTPERNLTVVFHEIFAVSPPWKRSFWKSFAQKKVVRRLSELADYCFTSTPYFQKQLEAIGVSAKICPVPSNIPQVQPKQKADSGIKAVIFGMAQSRRKALESHGQLLRQLQSSDQLGGLTIIGPERNASEASFIESSAVNRTGEISPDQIAEILSGSDILLSAHPPAELRKSGAAAAAMGNGCAVVMRGKQIESNPPSVCYSTAEEGVKQICGDGLGETSRASLRWYENNASWDACTRLLSAAVDKEDSTPR